MPFYRALQKLYINGRVVKTGEEFEYHGKPRPKTHMEEIAPPKGKRAGPMVMPLSTSRPRLAPGHPDAVAPVLPPLPPRTAAPLPIEPPPAVVPPEAPSVDIPPEDLADPRESAPATIDDLLN